MEYQQNLVSLRNSLLQAEISPTLSRGRRAAGRGPLREAEDCPEDQLDAWREFRVGGGRVRRAETLGYQKSITLCVALCWKESGLGPWSQNIWEVLKTADTGIPCIMNPEIKEMLPLLDQAFPSSSGR